MSPAVAVSVSYCCVGFDIALVDWFRREFPFNNRVGFTETLVKIASLMKNLARNV